MGIEETIKKMIDELVSEKVKQQEADMEERIYARVRKAIEAETERPVTMSELEEITGYSRITLSKWRDMGWFGYIRMTDNGIHKYLQSEVLEAIRKHNKTKNKHLIKAG